jgi:hypothetical protein
VKIVTSGGDIYKFQCNKWLARNEDDGVTERILYPGHAAEYSDFPADENRFSPRGRKSKATLLFRYKNLYCVLNGLKLLK